MMSPGANQHPEGQQNGYVGQVAGQPLPHITILEPPPWEDYELIDSGDGSKLERFGAYRLVRPDPQAIWKPGLPQTVWQQADASFQKGRGEDGPGEWVLSRSLPEQWQLQHEGLHFWARLTPFRHTGVFPEHSAHWPWMRRQLAQVPQPEVLVLFGYTGLHTLVAAQAGARVCHVDASRPATRWARANQELSHLGERPVRWIVDDVIKFVHRELRRGSRYDMIIMDPPVFGRGPKGEIWRLHEALQELVANCVQLLSKQPVGFLINAYATNISSISLFNVLYAAMQGYAGEVVAGELVLREVSATRPLPAALYGRWSAAG
jgi:23S rRNA (cytosine1962-C5)-methyltransferase